MRTSLIACLLPAIAVGIPAQATHLVGPGGYAQVSDALAVAAPGDFLHVSPGTYAPFAVTFGCTIRGLVPGAVLVQEPSGGASVTVTAPQGQVVHLAALDFSFSAAGHVAIQGGRVTLDQCTVLGAASIDPATAPLTATNADVHLQGCAVSCSNQFGFSVAMRATNARITAIDSQFYGSPLVPSFYYVCSPAVEATGTTLHASGCRFHAGVFGVGPVPGLHANGGRAWLCDSTVVGWGQGCPIEATTVLVDRCSLLPAAPSCTAPSGSLLGVSRPQPLQNGAGFSLTYTTVPNGYAAVFASLRLASLDIPGLHAQTQWLGGGDINLGIVLADATGQATATVPIPTGAWLVDQALWFQGVTGFSLPLQLSPVAGGLIR